MKIRTLQPVRHDEEDFEIGSEMELPDDQAQALIDVQAAELVAESKAASPKSPASNAKKGTNK